jgi:glucose-1-phosphate thymidylyltransferase
LQWLDGYIPPHPLKILNDGTKDEDKRLGAIGDLLFAIDGEKIKENIIVLACDMIFTFSLQQFLFSIERKPEENWVMLYDIGEKEEASSYGVAKVDELSRLTHYVEKPAQPFSSLVSIGIYYFPVGKFDLIRKFSRGHNTDAPGYYIEWLIKNDEVFAHVQRRGEWFDIGNKKQYQKVCKIMKRSQLFKR